MCTFTHNSRFYDKAQNSTKNKIQCLEHREVIRPFAKNINWSTFYSLLFKLKKSGKNAYAYAWRHFVKKMKIIFISPSGCARELKLRSFDSKSKTTSDCSNRFFPKKITLENQLSFCQWSKFDFYHRGVGINWPKNGLFRNGRVNFFECTQKLKTELQFDGKNL